MLVSLSAGHRKSGTCGILPTPGRALVNICTASSGEHTCKNSRSPPYIWGRGGLGLDLVGYLTYMASRHIKLILRTQDRESSFAIFNWAPFFPVTESRANLTPNDVGLLLLCDL